MNLICFAGRRIAALALLILISWPPGALQAAPAGVKTGEEILAEVSKRITDISTEELKALLKKDPGVYLIDVRTVRETILNGGTIRAKRNFIIPRGWLEFRVIDAVPDKDAPIIVYCGTNQRSPLAAEKLLQMGYTNVRNYAEGVYAWRKAGMPLEIADREPNSFLYTKPQKVIDGVWTATGATAPGTYENSGHNNNLSFIVTSDGVLVVNAGANYLLAKSLHEEIKKITDQPVKYVVLENGQGHAVLGSNYWKEQGVPIIAQAETARVIEENAAALIEVGTNRVRDKMFGTKIVMPDKTFEKKMVIEMGGERIELIAFGPAHSPGDMSVWMPEKNLIISGDIAFHKRLLPIFEDIDTAAWLVSWEKFAALKAKIVIPGHGGPTNMAEVTKYTKDYLVYMRTKMRELIDNGGSLSDAYKVDQSAYEHLDTFEFLALQNAGRIFRELEFE